MSKVANRIAEVKIVSVREPGPMPRARNSENIAKYWRRHITRASWYDPEREIAVVLSLNTRRYVISFSLVSLGTLNENIVHAREVFRPAIAQNAYAVIFMHNHPSGDPRPSPTDQIFTRYIWEAGDFLKIRVVDHVIVGSATSYFSFAQAKALSSGAVPKSKMHRSRY